MKKAASLLLLLTHINILSQPLYFVGGERVDNIAHIPHSNIKSIEHLDPTEQIIAQYGEAANEGVVLIELYRDSEAQFTAAPSFADYIEQQVSWSEGYNAARVVVRYTIHADGTSSASEVLSSSDSRLRRRVVKVIDEAEGWLPATKDGVAIDSEAVVSIELPKGKLLPAEPYVIKR